jgi:hypothetical protein
MIFNLLIALFFIYIDFGLFTLIQILILLIVFFGSNFLLGINPNAKQFLFIKIWALVTIIFILYHDYGVTEVGNIIILPVSVTKISYFDELESMPFIDTSSEEKLEINRLFVTTRITDFLRNLEDDVNYVATIEFTPEFPEYGMDNINQLLQSIKI